MLHILEVLFGTPQLIKRSHFFIVTGLLVLVAPVLIVIRIYDYELEKSILLPQLEGWIFILSLGVSFFLALSLYEGLDRARTAIWPLIPPSLFLITLLFLMIDIGLQSHDFTAAWGVLLGAGLICSSALTLSGGFVRKGISNLGLFHGLYNLFAGILLVPPGLCLPR